VKTQNGKSSVEGDCGNEKGRWSCVRREWHCVRDQWGKPQGVWVGECNDNNV